MVFITKAELLSAIDTATLTEISEGNDTNIDTAEAEAMDEMFGYLNVRFDGDAVFAKTGTERSPSIMQRLKDILIYRLHISISPDNIPALRKDLYSEAINWLEKVASGYINPKLPVKATEPTTPLRYGNSAEKQEQYF